jgi:hypothetical protein
LILGGCPRFRLRTAAGFLRGLLPTLLHNEEEGGE